MVAVTIRTEGGTGLWNGMACPCVCEAGAWPGRVRCACALLSSRSVAETSLGRGDTCRCWEVARGAFRLWAGEEPLVVPPPPGPLSTIVAIITTFSADPVVLDCRRASVGLTEGDGSACAAYACTGWARAGVAGAAVAVASTAFTGDACMAPCTGTAK